MATPFLAHTLTVARTLHPLAVCWKLIVQPRVVAVPVPLTFVPSLQQRMYSPVKELMKRAPLPLSSCMHTSKTVTLNVHEALLPDESVAVHKTVVVPAGNGEPDAGVQIADAPGQLSLKVGEGNVTGTDASLGCTVTARMSAGQIMLGG